MTAKGHRFAMKPQCRIPEFREKREGEDCTDLKPRYPGVIDWCLKCKREIK